MKISFMNDKKQVSFQSKIRCTNTLGYSINRAIELGDKGFFNAIKILANDGLNREIIVGGFNSTTKNNVSSTVNLKANNLEYSLNSSLSTKHNINAFQLMWDNVIKLIKKLASETADNSQKALNEISTKDILVKEANEFYRTIF